jgi:hypothetical protein
MADKKLPDTQESVSVLKAKQEAHETVSGLIERNLELEDIFEALQPLLYTLSVALYGDDASDVSLQKLVEDSVKMLTGRDGELQ